MNTSLIEFSKVINRIDFPIWLILSGDLKIVLELYLSCLPMTFQVYLSGKVNDMIKRIISNSESTSFNELRKSFEISVTRSRMQARLPISSKSLGMVLLKSKKLYSISIPNCMILEEVVHVRLDHEPQIYDQWHHFL